MSVVGSLVVAGVQFKLNGTNLGAEDTSAPYSTSWNTTNTSNGSHTLTAVARDTLGVRYTSAPVTVTVRNTTDQLPQVSFTRPASGAALSGTVAINARAFDPDAGTTDGAGISKVVFELRQGTAVIASRTESFVTYDWSLNTALHADGAYTLRATAFSTTSAGGGSAFVDIPVTLDNTAPADATPPTVAITSPASGATVSGTVTVEASASDNVVVAGAQFFVDSTAPIGAEDTTAPYSVSWDTTAVADGSHTLTAVARDGAGNTTTSAINVTVANGAPPPIVTRFEETAATLAPAGAWSVTTNADSGVTLSGDQAVFATAAGASAAFTFTGTGVSWLGLRCEICGIAHVSVDGAMVATVDTFAPPPRSAEMMFTTSGLAAGNHSLLIEVTGTASASSGGTAVVVDAFDVMEAPPDVDTTPPAAAITAPASGETVSGIIPVSASASDNVGVVGVRFFAGAVEIGVEDTETPYGVSWDTTAVADGSHTLTAIARDSAGNSTTSAAVSVTVANGAPPDPDATPPSVAITSPASGATVSGTVTVEANASDNVAVAGVRFFVGTVEIGIEDTEAPHEVSWDTTAVADGSHTLTAVARDSAGNTTTSAPVSVTVANEAPPPPPAEVTRFEELDPSITYTGSWGLNTDRPWSGGQAAVSLTAGSQAAFTFTGSSVSWIGFRGPQVGIANVFLDGVFVREVDTFSPTEEVQAVVFTATGLAAGTHTLMIEVTGTANASSSNVIIVVDAFDVFN